MALCLIEGMGGATAQERYSPFVPSDMTNVERMVILASVKLGDVVVDLRM